MQLSEMSIVQVKGTGRRLAERNAFYGSSVPVEIKRMIKPLKKLDQSTFRSLLQGETTSPFCFHLIGLHFCLNAVMFVVSTRYFCYAAVGSTCVLLCV